MRKLFYNFFSNNHTPDRTQLSQPLGNYPENLDKMIDT